jgi:predicted transposase/invertase (TIGR01784 family)
MQMNWTSAFLQRVLFNASKAYVRQLEKGEQYELLQPVMGLSLLDDVFDRQSDEFYHHYQFVNTGRPERVIKDLQLVFVELPKFKKTSAMAPLKQAWLRFLRETGAESTAEAQQLFLEEVGSQAPEIRNALELSGEAGFSKAELEAYDRYWDVISSERTLLAGKYAEGKAEGLMEGEARGQEKAKNELYARLAAAGMEEEEARKLVFG